MDSYRDSISRILKDQPIRQQRFSVFKCILQSFTHYETPKMAHFEKKWIGFVSLIIKLSVAFICLYLMFQRESYQIFDRSPISAVIIKVKQSTTCSNNDSILSLHIKYNCSTSLHDVNDFVIPAIENAAVSITTRIIETKHILKYCSEKIKKKNSTYSSLYTTAILHKCTEKSNCILPPFYRSEYDNNGTPVNKNLCWFKLPSTPDRLNYNALDYIIFIKHFIEFIPLALIQHNLLSNIITKNYLDTCEYDPHTNPLCPKFRVLKILKMLNIKPHEYESMFFYGSLIEIRINWKCNLDNNIKYCEPSYEFKRLDVQPYSENPYHAGSNFLTSRHFFRSNDRQLHRIHTQIFNLHIAVSVSGEAGKFDLFQTTTSIGSFLGIWGMVSIVCDLIAGFITHFNKVKYEN